MPKKENAPVVDKKSAKPETKSAAKTLNFIVPKRGTEATEAEAKNNTLYLRAYLKKNFEPDEVGFDDEKGVVVANGYGMRYSGDAFKLVSKVDGKLVTQLPDPKSTLEYIKSKPIVLKKEMSPEEMAKAEAAGKLAKDHPLKPSDAKPEDDDALKLTPASKKLVGAVQAILDGVKEEVYSIAKVRQIIAENISPEDTPRYEKLVGLVKSFMKEEIKFPELSKQFDAEIQPLIEVVRSKAPKFDGLDEVRFLNNGTIKIHKNGNIEGQVEVDEKVEDFSMTKFEYLVNIILSHFPKAMPLVMKLAQGKTSFTSGDDTFDLTSEKTFKLKNFVPDSFEPFDEKVLEAAKKDAQERVISFAEFVLSYKGVPNAYTIKFDNELKRGDRVRVKWSGYHCHWDGTVIATKFGVNIHYDDGYRFYLENVQPYNVIGEASQEELTKLDGTAPVATEAPVEEAAK